MTKISLIRTTLLLIICTVVTNCGGGGGGSDSSPDDFFSNNSCSLLKIAQRNTTAIPVKKIINGTQCNQSSSPVIQLILADKQNRTFTCTATMLTKQYALSAAHCFDNGIDRAVADINGEIIPVEAIKIHPQAKDTRERYINDLSIVKFTKPIDITTVPLLLSRNATIGDKLFIYGYGRSTPGTAAEGTDEKLRGGVMKISSIDTISIFANFDGQGQNACFGDSGGPAMIEVNGQLAIAGVTSTGNGSDNCGVGDTNLFANLQTNASLGFITTFVPGVGSL